MAQAGKRTKRKSAPENETKREKFVRLVQFRMSKALNAIRQVGQLSGSAYEFTPKDIEQCTAALNKEWRAVLERFEGKSQAGGGFTLGGE